MTELLWNGDQVRALRSALGLSQTDFGVQCGLASSGAQALISKWERTSAPDRQKGNLNMINQNAGYPVQGTTLQSAPTMYPKNPDGSLATTPSMVTPAPTASSAPAPSAAPTEKRQRRKKMSFPEFSGPRLIQLRAALNLSREDFAELLGQRTSYADTLSKLEDGTTKMNTIQQLAFNHVLGCAMSKWPDGAQIGEIDPKEDYVEVLQVPYGGIDYLTSGALPNNIAPVITDAEWHEADPQNAYPPNNIAPVITDATVQPATHPLGGPQMQQLAPTSLPPSPMPPSAAPAGYETPDLSWAESRLAQPEVSLPIPQQPVYQQQVAQTQQAPQQQQMYQQAPQPMITPPLPVAPPVVAAGRVFTPNMQAYIEATGLPFAAVDAYLNIQGRSDWVQNPQVTPHDIANDFNACRQAGLC